MARLGETTLFSAASLSNILFWRDAGYFDASAAVKPLLHTWSLSVEEQFYLIWPAALVIASRVRRPRSVVALVITVGTASFALAEIFRPTIPDAVFYLVPFRMFEFCAGAALVFAPRPSRRRLWAELAMIAGFSVLAYSVTCLVPNTAIHPLWPVLPCFGATLIIYVGGRAPWTCRLLSNRLSMAVGTISYSLYLVHWPIIVFYRYARSNELLSGEKLLLVALCFIAAAPMYRLVELPFRSPMPASRKPAGGGRAWGLVGATLALCVCTVGADAWYSGGWSFRLPAEMRRIPSEGSMWAERDPFARVGKCFIYSPASSFSDFDVNACLKLDPAKPNYLIIGDSFAADAYVYLSAAYPGINFLQATAGGCVPLVKPAGDEICSSLLRFIFGKFIPHTKLDGVVLSASWQWDYLDQLDKTIDMLRTETPRVVLVGPVMRYRSNAQAFIFQSKCLTIDCVERFADSTINPFEYTLNDNIHQRFRAKVAYIDVQSILCENYCRLFTPDRKIIHIDFGHLTVAGSHYLGQKIVERYERDGLKD